jgi:hypothetical protein
MLNVLNVVRVQYNKRPLSQWMVNKIVASDVNNAIDYEELENRREDMLPLISLSEF